MKKTILFLGGLFLIIGTATAQSFTITSPNGGEKWEFGAPRVVTWTYSSIPDGTLVKLVLFQNTNKIGNIVQNIVIGSNGMGSYTWKVGSLESGVASIGNGFTIRIRDMNGQYPPDESDGPFEITSPPSKTVQPLEGSFEIESVTCLLQEVKSPIAPIKPSEKDRNDSVIKQINVVVAYDAKNDFMICIPEGQKCSDAFGSLQLIYQVTNWMYVNAPVSDTKISCNYACLQSCGNITIPGWVQPRGKGKFTLLVFPVSKNEKVYGFAESSANTLTGGAGWFTSPNPDYQARIEYAPEIEVFLTLCMSFYDKNYSYKMVPKSLKVKIPVRLKEMEIGTSGGWL